MKMIIGWLTGRNKELAALEIECVLAREFAPALAITIVTQSPLLSHTVKWPSRWGQLPSEWAATTAARTLSNLNLALGGTMRVVELLAEDDQPKSFELADATLAGLAGYLMKQLNLPAGRSVIGLSAVGELSFSWLKRLMGAMKQQAKQQSSSLRVVLPERPQGSGRGTGWPELSAASVRHNRLLDKGSELVLIPTGQSNRFYVGLTLTIHHPDRDAWLDRNIPQSDALSGMLPPKLARMLVNIGLGQSAASETEKKERPTVVLDPFCGNGRVLLEALLLGQPVQGRDIDRVKVAATETNINWLRREGPKQPWWPTFVAEADLPPASVYQHDAVEKWRQTWKGPHVIVSEPWLGPPLRQRPTALEARQHAARVKTILEAAIPHLLSERPRRVVLVIPRWLLTPTGELVITPEIVAHCQRQGFVAKIIATVQRPDSFIARDVILVTQT